MKTLIFFLQFDWDKLRPENLFGGQILERTPAGLSIIYLIGLAVLLIFLLLSFFSNFRRPQFAFENDLPAEVKRRLTSTVTNPVDSFETKKDSLHTRGKIVLDSGEQISENK